VTSSDGFLLQEIPRDCNSSHFIQKSRQKRQDYDGWLAYTTFHYPQGIDSFLGYFSVPNNPQNVPEVLYLFTGLQNVDWIPIGNIFSIFLIHKWILSPPFLILFNLFFSTQEIPPIGESEVGMLRLIQGY
jgi:hypothetical protein